MQRHSIYDIIVTIIATIGLDAAQGYFHVASLCLQNGLIFLEVTQEVFIIFLVLIHSLVLYYGIFDELPRARIQVVSVIDKLDGNEILLQR